MLAGAGGELGQVQAGALTVPAIQVAGPTDPLANGGEVEAGVGAGLLEDPLEGLVVSRVVEFGLGFLEVAGLGALSASAGHGGRDRRVGRAQLSHPTSLSPLLAIGTGAVALGRAQRRGAADAAGPPHGLDVQDVYGLLRDGVVLVLVLVVSHVREGAHFLQAALQGFAASGSATTTTIISTTLGR